MGISQEAYDAHIGDKVAQKLEDKEVNNMVNDMADDAGGASSSGINIDFSFLLAKTGEGAIEDYIEHPLNFTRSKGLAQVLRGATGLVGALDLAIIDMGIGALNMVRENKVGANIGNIARGE